MDPPILPCFFRLPHRPQAMARAWQVQHDKEEEENEKALLGEPHGHGQREGERSLDTRCEGRLYVRLECGN